MNEPIDGGERLARSENISLRHSENSEREIPCRRASDEYKSSR
jgi:hypothetical protein